MESGHPMQKMGCPYFYANNKRRGNDMRVGIKWAGRSVLASTLSAALALGAVPFAGIMGQRGAEAADYVDGRPLSYVSSDGEMYLYQKITDSGGWHVPDGVGAVDVFLCGAGKPGSERESGDGGATKTILGYRVTPGSYVPVKVGEYNGQDSVFGSLTSAGGEVAKGIPGYVGDLADQYVEKVSDSLEVSGERHVLTFNNGVAITRLPGVKKLVGADIKDAKFSVGEDSATFADNGRYTQQVYVNGSPLMRCTKTMQCLCSRTQTDARGSDLGDVVLSLQFVLYGTDVDALRVYIPEVSDVSSPLGGSMTVYGKKKDYVIGVKEIQSEASCDIKEKVYLGDLPLDRVDITDCGIGSAGAYAFDDSGFDGVYYGSSGSVGSYGYYSDGGCPVPENLMAGVDAQQAAKLGSGYGFGNIQYGSYYQQGYTTVVSTADGVANRGGGGSSAWHLYSSYGGGQQEGMGNGSSGVVIVRWEADYGLQDNKSVVTYDVTTNGGESETPGDIVCKTGSLQNSKSEVMSQTASRSGYTFVGWNTDKDATEGLSSVKVNGDTLLYAIFKKDASVSFIDYANSEKQSREVEPTMFNRGGSAQIIMPVQNSVDGWESCGWASESPGVYHAGWGCSVSGGETFYGVYGKDVSVSFDPCGGSVTLESRTVRVFANSYDFNSAYGTVRLPGAVEKSGATFVGWAAGSVGGAVYQPGALAHVSGDTVFYAVYSDSPYTVQFHSNGGAGSMGSLVCVGGSSFALPSNRFARDGYEFAGWALSASGGVRYGDGATVESLAGGSNVFYAVWKPTGYSIAFDSGYGAHEVKFETAEYGKAFVLPRNVFEREGYEFKGWSTVLGGASEYVDRGTVTGVAGGHGMVLYACWESNQYTISFKTPDASGVMEAVGAEYGSLLNLPPNLFQREGYEFAGWALTQDSSGILIADRSPVINLTAKSAVSLYAVWQPKEFRVVFDDGVSVSEERVPVGQDYVLPGCSRVTEYTVTFDPCGGRVSPKSLKAREGFLGWEIGGKLYQPGSPVRGLVTSNTETIKAKAKWGHPSITLPVPERSKYTFKGWADGKSTKYYSGEYTVSGDVAFQAVWEADDTNVTVNVGGATNLKDLKVGVTPGKKFPELEIMPKKELAIMLSYGGLATDSAMTAAYRFTGIFSEKGGKGKRYYDADGNPDCVWEMGSANTVYVNWEPAIIVLPSPEFKDYTFIGWKTADGIQTGPWMPTKSQTVTVQVEGKKYHITYHLDGGALKDAPDSYEFGRGCALPVPGREGYLFQGWYSSGERVDKIDKTSRGDIDLTAKWVSIEEAGSLQGDKNITEATVASGTAIIPDGFYKNCSNLEKVTFPEGVVKIGEGAFEGCKSLKVVDLPDSLEGIGKNAFRNCTGMEQLKLPSGLVSIGDSAFEGCKGLGCVDLPGSLEEIGKSAFRNCTGLEKAQFLMGLKRVGDSAFEGCSSLKAVSMPDSVEDIGTGAFKNCSALEGVAVGAGCSSIGAQAFSGCPLLIEIDVPANVGEIGKDCFKGCGALKRVVVRNNNCSIGDSADTFPEGAVLYGYVPSGAYDYAQKYGRGFVQIGEVLQVTLVCDGSRVPIFVSPGGTLPKSVAVPARISGDSIKFMGYYMSDGMQVYDGDGSLILDRYTVDEGFELFAKWEVTKRPKPTVKPTAKPTAKPTTKPTSSPKTSSCWKSGIKYVLSGKTAKVSKVKKDKAKAVVLAKVSIGGKSRKVTAVGNAAFKGCTKLKKVVLGKYVASLGRKAFHGDKSLKKIVVKGKIVHVRKDALKGTGKGLVIDVRKQSVKSAKKLFKGKGNAHVLIK